MQEFRTILELIYFASGPLLLIVAGIGLWQLKIAKDTSRIQASRAALSLSAERCEHYHSHIIPLVNKLDKAVEKHNIKYYTLFEVKIEGKKIQITPNCDREVYLAELEKSNHVIAEICETLNAIEAFSVFFISRVADESIAYTSVGRTFCHTVRKYIADIVTVSDCGGHYDNLLKLFLLWNSRMQSEKLIRDKQKIENEIGKLEKRCIQPFGTE